MCSFIYLPISAGHSCFALVLFSATFAPVFPTDLDASDLHALPRLRGVLPVPRLLCHSLIPCRSPVPSWQKSWNTRAIFRDNQDSEGLSPAWTGFHVLPRLALTFGPPSPSPVNLALWTRAKVRNFCPGFWTLSMLFPGYCAALSRLFPCCSPVIAPLCGEVHFALHEHFLMLVSFLWTNVSV